MQGDDNMNNDWRKEYLFQKNFTDDDFEKETDIEKLLMMFLNWKQVEGRWSETAQKRFDEVKKMKLTDSQRQLLEELQ